MFKCDLCRDRLAENQSPFCIETCPQKAMKIGRRDAIFEEAEKLKAQYNGHIYGKEENGGTSTLYVSPVSFDKIEKALAAEPKKKGRKIVGFSVPENILSKQRNWALLSLVAPILGVVAALGLSGRGKEEEQ